MPARILELRHDNGFAPAGDVELFRPASGFSGAISLPLLPDLIQIYTVSMADGALTIRRGADRGTIWFERGEIVHAECGELTGEEAVYHLLQWQNGQFSLDRDARAPLRTIDIPWQNVLLEGCRRLDEQPQAQHDEDDALSELAALPGFRGAALFDAHGMLIAQRTAADGLALDLHGQLLLDMLRAQPQRPGPLLDCYWILGDQEHVIVPLADGGVLHLILNRDAVNLAVVRRTIERVAARLA